MRFYHWTYAFSLGSIVSQGLLPRARLHDLPDRPYLTRYVEPWTTPERWRLLDDYVTLSLQPDTWAAKKRDALVVIDGSLATAPHGERFERSFWVRGIDTMPDVDLTEDKRCTDTEVLARWIRTSGGAGGPTHELWVWGGVEPSFIAEIRLSATLDDRATSVAAEIGRLASARGLTFRIQAPTA